MRQRTAFACLVIGIAASTLPSTVCAISPWTAPLVLDKHLGTSSQENAHLPLMKANLALLGLTQKQHRMSETVRFSALKGSPKPCQYAQLRKRFSV